MADKDANKRRFNKVKISAKANKRGLGGRSDSNESEVPIEVEFPCPWNEDRARYMHINRITTKAKTERVCFVCRTTNSEELLICGYKTLSGRCMTPFHQSCLGEYSAADFNVAIVKDLMSLKKDVCPLHVCSLCFLERYRHTACAGDLIECSQCYRAFHMECRPPGSHIAVDKNGKETVTCPIHAPPIKELKSRLQFCCECELGKESTGVLVPCSRCSRSYHEACNLLKNAIGTPKDENLCEVCINGDSVRIGDAVIAKYYGQYHSGIVVEKGEYPDKKTPLWKNNGMLAVRWTEGGKQSLVSCHSIVPMFTDAHKHFKFINETHEQHFLKCEEEWGETDSSRPKFDLYKTETVTNILTSEYATPSMRSEYATEVVEEDMLCSCPSVPPGKEKCFPGKCSNASLQQECPPCCEEDGQICLNRQISRHTHCPYIESFRTEEKGRGVRTTQALKAGDFIAEYAGEIITIHERRQRQARDLWNRNFEERHYYMELDKGRSIDCRYKGNIARLINHSCAPNCHVSMVMVYVGKAPTQKKLLYDTRIQIRAMRAIEKGEEVSFDYGMEKMSDVMTVPDCMCGEECCTGTLCAPTDEDEKNKRDKKYKKRPLAVKEAADTRGPTAAKDQGNRTSSITRKEPKKRRTEGEKENC